jgi:ABC-type microcin C transport system permease subunit YejE
VKWSFNQVLAHPAYLALGLAGAKVTAVIGLYCGAKDKEVLNMEAEDWFGLSALYMLFVIASIAAQILLKFEEMKTCA